VERDYARTLLGFFFLLSPSALAQVEMENTRLAPFVALVDLNVPHQAQREFRQANELMMRQNWTKAIEKLHRATAIYPDYAAAHNNLAVAYERIGDEKQERGALETAIRLNDYFAMAYVNLGRLNLVANDFRQAEILLQRASALESTNATTLSLLAYAQFRDQHLDDALATTRKAHDMPQAHAFAHRVAARVYEQKNQLGDASAELRTFLREEPRGARAESARQELTILQSLLR
jgi:superkiller protein 3